jgi:threonine/homoserine/homoserine lactone efflux protein
VVARASITGGRNAGLRCAAGHGVGFGLYALAVVFGLATLMAQQPTLFALLQWLGAALLIYLGVRSLRAAPRADAEAARQSGGFVTGFLTAFLNPKIALFFVAVFAAVLQPDMPFATQIGIAVMGWAIDTGWYAIVALALSAPSAVTRMQRAGAAIDYAMGMLLLALAAVTVWRLLAAG